MMMGPNGMGEGVVGVGNGGRYMMLSGALVIIGVGVDIVFVFSGGG